MVKLTKWQKKVRLYNRKGYKYCGLFKVGGGYGEMYSEWEKPDGEKVRIYYDR